MLGIRGSMRRVGLHVRAEGANRWLVSGARVMPRRLGVQSGGRAGVAFKTSLLYPRQMAEPRHVGDKGSFLRHVSKRCGQATGCSMDEGQRACCWGWDKEVWHPCCFSRLLHALPIGPLPFQA